MSGEGAGAPARAPDVFEDEAAESGSGSGDEDEGDVGETGDLAGFVVPANEADDAAAAADGDASSSSDDEMQDEELLDEDIDVLAEAGVDVSQMKRKREEAAEPPASGEPASQRPRLDEGSVGSLGGGGGGLLAAVRASVDAGGGGGGGDGGDEDFGAFSDDSVDDFVVDDPSTLGGGSTRDTDTLGITEDQKNEIIDIFGDTSVLRPIDEMDQGLDDFGSEDEAMAARSMAPTPPKPEAASPASVGSLAGAMAAMTPSAATLEKSKKMAERLPPRWVDAYMSEPMLISQDGIRTWSAEEEVAEAQWIFHEAFADRNNKDEIIEAIGEVLRLLHAEKLEPVAVASQYECFLGRALYRADIWKVCDLDQTRWQRIWLSYMKLRSCLIQCPRTPDHIKARVTLNTFDKPKSEHHILDTLGWFAAEYPKDSGGQNGARTYESQVIAKARESQFDKKLGIVESLEPQTMQVVSITPAEFGTNIEKGEHLYSPDPDRDDETVPAAVWEQHTTEDFASKEGVENAITVLLSHLIAKEPRLRGYVREQFTKMCAVSTFPTETGKPLAEEASLNLQRRYRAFHIVNRPLQEFKKDDELFLDVLDLERKGFITIEYSLIVTTEGSSKNKYVMMGHDSGDVVRDRQRLAEHMLSMDPTTREVPPPEGKDEIAKWNWCTYMRPRLEAIARAAEIETRWKSTRSDYDKAETPFLCANMSINYDDLNQLLVADPIFEHLAEFYSRAERRTLTEWFVVPGPWNSLRKTILLRALRDELYPQFWAEAQAELARRAEEAVCFECGKQLESIVDRQPWKPTSGKAEMDDAWDVDDVRALKAEEDDEAELRDPDAKSEKAARFRGYCSALVVMPEVRDEFSVIAYVDQYGDPRDMRKFFSNFTAPAGRELEPGSQRELKRQQRNLHQREFKGMLRAFEPAVILLPVCDNTNTRAKKNITEIIEAVHAEKRFKIKPTVVVCDPTVPRLVAFHPKTMEQGAYRDCDPLQRTALSMARFIQDPLAETAQLWDATPASNELLKLRLHRLQDNIPSVRLARALENTMMDSLAKAGIHVNRVRRSTHLSAVACFLPGFGCKRVDVFQKCLASSSISSRQQMVDRIVATFRSNTVTTHGDVSSVISNCMPFVRICPDHRDIWHSTTTPSFDRTRVSDGFRPWLDALCKAALMDVEGVEDDADKGDGDVDWIARAMTYYQSNKAGGLKSKLYDLIWKGSWDWETEAGLKFPANGQPDKLLDVLSDELIDPGADRREPLAGLSNSTLFSLAVGSPAENYSAGTLVHAVVLKDLEIPDPDYPDKEAKAQVKVKVQPCMVGGQFAKQYGAGSGKGYIPGCERHFEEEEVVLVRIVRTSAEEDRDANILLTMDQDSKSFYEAQPISEADLPYFVPFATENWLQAKVGVVGGGNMAELAELKSWIRRPRNIRHPNWFTGGHDEAMAEIVAAPLGNVLFRTSKRHDIILGLLKVRATDYAAGDSDVVAPAQSFRTFDIVELENKTISKGFELAHKLAVDGQVYKDFDEIIARHIDPIMDNLRLLREHPRYGMGDGSITNREDIVQTLNKLSKDDRKSLMYSMLMHSKHTGHGLLIWVLGGKTPREELIEVTHEGFALWGKHFTKITELIKWFKAVGWREATTRRQEFKDKWKARQEEIQKLRGKNAYADRPTKSKGWSATQTSLGGGLQTPGGTGGLSTPKGGWNFNMEASAPTPSGLKTPTGNATPNLYRNPATPMAPISPRAPGTPSGARAAWGRLSRQPATPMAPASPVAPGTPSGGARAQGGWGMMTPAVAPQTPAGMGGGWGVGVPATPAVAPQTPAGMGGGRSFGVPATPVKDARFQD